MSAAQSRNHDWREKGVMRPPYSVFENLGYIVALIVGAIAPLLVVGMMMYVEK